MILTLNLYHNFHDNSKTRKLVLHSSIKKNIFLPLKIQQIEHLLMLLLKKLKKNYNY